MRPQIKLFLCYPLAPITPLVVAMTWATFSRVPIFPVLAFGIQGLQALLLSLTLQTPGEEPVLQSPRTPEIGWES
jgi:hypothetical protein